jgi:integrase
MEYPEAPIKDVRKLIYQTDKPSINYKSDYQKIKYIPDGVLEPLIPHLNELPVKVRNAVWIMFKTGLRVSDTLDLRQDCLLKINGKYWIETNIQKTGIIGHRIPIDDDLAQIIAGMINKVRNGELPINILNMLWTNHKLNAIETLYGTCMQRIKGKCEYAKHPSCLTCNNGSPCKDLCLGAVDWDIRKYEILVESTKSMIKFSEEYDRKDFKKRE